MSNKHITFQFLMDPSACLLLVVEASCSIASSCDGGRCDCHHQAPPLCMLTPLCKVVWECIGGDSAEAEKGAKCCCRVPPLPSLATRACRGVYLGSGNMAEWDREGMGGAGLRERVFWWCFWTGVSHMKQNQDEFCEVINSHHPSVYFCFRKAIGKVQESQ